MKKFFLLILFVILNYTIAFPQEITKCVSSNANLRSDSTFADNVIATIPKGTCLTGDRSIFETEWIVVVYNGRQGFVHSSLFKSNEIQIDKSSSSYTNYDNSNSSESNKNYYINSKGEKVQSPTNSSTVPDGATAICNDGTYSFSQSRRGTCSHHGGVRQWLND
jgi:hypothetical protein